MTKEEYWRDLLAYWAGLLPQEKVLKYKLAGCFAESAARERGSTLIADDMLPPGEFPRPEQLPEELLVAVGMSVLAVKDVRPEGV